MAEKIGNPAHLLAHFTEGLRRLRQIGPPIIPCNPMTIEEERFAMVHNATEDYQVQKLLQMETLEKCR